MLDKKTCTLCKFYIPSPINNVIEFSQEFGGYPTYGLCINPLSRFHKMGVKETYSCDQYQKLEKNHDKL